MVIERTHDSMTKLCPFCSLAAERIISQDKFCLVFRDGYPVSPGHTLIVTKRHIGSFFETTKAERASLLHLLDEAKAALDTEFHPASYNIGINDGASAGQTVPHLHIHLIPRYEGDCLDPRGGIRWIFPEKAKYWP